MPQLELLDLASERFATLADTVTEDLWTNPTPCDEWDVGALVDHEAAEPGFGQFPRDDRAAEPGPDDADALHMLNARFTIPP